MAQEIPKVYDPKEVEPKWYDFWLKEDYFQAEIDKKRKPFTIVIPPPNITGSLHMGHALNNTLQDIVIRKKRMDGKVALWLPGTDHAGIATQNVVEQELAKEGSSRQDIGREEFVDRVWQWKEKYGSTIITQLKRLGCSCDWSRERFTMDESYSKAVQEVFVRLYEEGLIYRGHYIINWCPRCHTALSDIEVEHRDIEGHLWYIKYLIKGENDSITIATTRPETLLGDTGVAVNPEDKRFKKYIGKTAILPALGREIPIIGDDYVDMSFGTGALKITPAHDPYDFEIGKRHDLAEINIFSEDAKINQNGGKYQGLDRYESRDQLVDDLKQEGLLEKVEGYGHAVGHCYRCDTVIEPYLSEQWFVKMKPLAEPAIQAVKEKKVEFVPQRWEKIYYEWMESIKDWCISRQLWWGHRIPVWYCQDLKNEKCKMQNGIIAKIEEPKECPYCKSSKIVQDKDVLDTWFSSWLWPFAILGWPEGTEDLTYFYPTALLSTAFDIIFFWVARMIMAGLHFAEDVPFEKVYIHALIRDAKGQKMSKSRGNVIDPISIIDQYGTDALRFTLTSLATPGRDIYLSEERIQGYRNFANKIWNASRFILMNLDGYAPSEVDEEKLELTLADRWILSEYSKLSSAINKDMESYQFSKVARNLYDFFWGDFCDWYIELSKPRLYSQASEVGSGESSGDNKEKEAGTDNRLPTTGLSKLTAQHVLFTILEGTLRLLHPVIPFITEEIWQRLQSETRNEERPASIMISSYPTQDKKLVNREAEKDMEVIQKVTIAIRSIRSDFNVPPDKKMEAILNLSDNKEQEMLKKHSNYITLLAGISALTIGSRMEKPEHAATAVEQGIEIYVPLVGLLDVEKEKSRLNSKLKQANESLTRAEKKLKNQAFIEKAPQEVVAKEKEKLNALLDEKKKIEAQLKQIS